MWHVIDDWIGCRICVNELKEEILVNEVNNWRFCAVGNIVKEHVDADGNVFYGTKAFTGGTKVYIDDRTYLLNKGRISVIGLNRFKRYAVESVPVMLIENVRMQRIYKPTVLEIMDYLEACDGWVWRKRTADDKRAVKAFVEKWESNYGKDL